MDEQTLQILLAIFSATTLVSVSWLKIQNDKIRDIKSKLSDKKYQTYHEILAILFDLISQSKNIKSVSEVDILNRIMNIKRDLILYGNDKMVKKFFEWEENQHKSAYRLWNWAELAAISRKDMGNRFSKINTEKIFRSLFSNEKDYLKFKSEYLISKKG